jgi:hypothetical protein
VALKVVTREEWESLPEAKALKMLEEGAWETIHWVHRRSGKWAKQICGGICCGTMPTNKRDTTDALMVTLFGEDEEYNKWWDYILDPVHSPWHRVLGDGVTMYQLSSTRHQKAFKIEIGEGTGFKDLVNLLIATRQTYEDYVSVRGFSTAWDVYKGIDPTCTFR